MNSDCQSLTVFPLKKIMFYLDSDDENMTTVMLKCWWKTCMQVILLTECDGGGGLSFVRKSKIEGEVFGEYFGLLI